MTGVGPLVFPTETSKKMPKRRNQDGPSMMGSHIFQVSTFWILATTNVLDESMAVDLDY